MEDGEGGEGEVRGGKSLWREKADKMVTQKKTHGVLVKKRINEKRLNVCEG